MEDQTTTPHLSGSGSSSAVYPRWVILEQSYKSPAAWQQNVPLPTAIANTLAAARTSNGLPIQASLSLQEPPATSVVRVRFPDGVRPKYCIPVAAHGGFLLIEVKIERGYAESTLDYFVYNAGDAAADPPRPPSLLLLPPYYLSERELGTGWTGILRRRRDEDDEVVVADLQMVPVNEDDTAGPEVAELLLFSSGEWSVKRPRIWQGDDEILGELPTDWSWSTTSVFPVGDTTLCWTDNYDARGILLCRVLEETPWLQYVPLPTVPSPCSRQNVCATGAGGHGTVKLVNIFPRCCCAGAGVCHCQRSHHAYTIETWTLRMVDDDGMEWVMDGMVDAAELWCQDIYKGLPRVPLWYPVVSLYEPHVICSMLCENHYVKLGGDLVTRRYGC